MIHFATLRKLVKYILFGSIIDAHQNNEKVSSKFLQREKQTQGRRVGLQSSREKFSMVATAERKREREKHLCQQTEVSNNTKYITE